MSNESSKIGSSTSAAPELCFDELLRRYMGQLDEAAIAAIERDIERYERTGMSSPRILRVFSGLQGLVAKQDDQAASGEPLAA